MPDKEVKLHKELRTIKSLVRILHEGNDMGRQAAAYSKMYVIQYLDTDKPGTWYSLFHPFNAEGLKYMGRDHDWIYFVRVEISTIHH